MIIIGSNALGYKIGRKSLSPQLEESQKQNLILKQELEQLKQELEQLKIREQTIEELKEKLNDYDGDGYANDFEINIAKTDPLIPNGRYLLLFNSISNDFTEENFTASFLVETKTPPENIIKLFYREATANNLERAFDELTKKMNENDILFLSIFSHGNPYGFECEEGVTFYYPHLDECLDKIRARAMIIIICACGSQDPLLFDALRAENRVIVTADHGSLLTSLLEILGYEIPLEVSLRCVFEKDTGILMNLSPAQQWVKDRYNSMKELLEKIDKDGNGYISLGEALEWISLMRQESFKELKEKNEKILMSNPCTIDNLLLAFQLYLSDHSFRDYAYLHSITKP